MKGAESYKSIRYPLTIAMTFQDSERLLELVQQLNQQTKHYHTTRDKSFMYRLVQNQMIGIISLLRNILMNISQMIQILLKLRMA